MEKLSVIIPAYRAEKYLGESVASVRRQNWPGELEIIIVDDGSDDGTYSLARELGNIALTKERGGAASARNMGLREATGDLVFLLDADDVLTEGAFDRFYKEFVCRPEIKAVFGLARDFISPELTEEQQRGLQIRQGGYGGVLPGCAMLRREIFEKIGFFDESLKSGETVAWQMKLRESAMPCAFLDFVTLERRLHLSNTGRVDSGQEMKNYAAILRKRMKEKGEKK